MVFKYEQVKKYIRNYYKFHDIGEGEFLYCRICIGVAQDLHHIHIKGMGGRKKVLINGKEFDIDDPINLIPLCREHHSQAHGGKWTKEYLIDLNKS